MNIIWLQVSNTGWMRILVVSNPIMQDGLVLDGCDATCNNSNRPKSNLEDDSINVAQHLHDKMMNFSFTMNRKAGPKRTVREAHVLRAIPIIIPDCL